MWLITHLKKRRWVFWFPKKATTKHQRPKILLSGHQAITLSKWVILIRIENVICKRERLVIYLWRRDHEKGGQREAWKLQALDEKREKGWWWEMDSLACKEESSSELQLSSSSSLSLCRGKFWDHNLNQMELAFTTGH